MGFDGAKQIFGFQQATNTQRLRKLSESGKRRVLQNITESDKLSESKLPLCFITVVQVRENMAIRAWLLDRHKFFRAGNSKSKPGKQAVRKLIDSAIDYTV